MPRRPSKPCAAPGCRELVAGGERCCTRHQQARQQDDAQHRGTAHERGYTSAWTRARSAYLKAHPLCVRCTAGGRVTEATVVDHITPHRLKDAIDTGNAQAIAKASALFWDRATNWQSLCKTHHDAKTANEDGGFGRAPGR